MERTFNQKQAAHELGMSYHALVWYRKTGQISHHREGGGRGFVRYTAADLAAFRAKRG